VLLLWKGDHPRSLSPVVGLICRQVYAQSTAVSISLRKREASRCAECRAICRNNGKAVAVCRFQTESPRGRALYAYFRYGVLHVKKRLAPRNRPLGRAIDWTGIRMVIDSVDIIFHFPLYIRHMYPFPPHFLIYDLLAVDVLVCGAV